ncbi:MAG: WxcM-like domain-containing protein [Muribaculaceae bacterium]|nr:WxcM-like domain-containing protein [Muribaculaceae bacterium]
MNHQIISLPKFHDPRGNLTAVEDCAPIPFDIHRVYWLYDIPAGSERGGHSHKQQQEVLIAISGSFQVTLTDGVESVGITLNRPDKGLLIPTGIWRTIDNFSAGAVCLVLASAPFDENDYIRDYDEFLKSK